MDYKGDPNTNPPPPGYNQGYPPQQQMYPPVHPSGVVYAQQPQTVVVQQQPQQRPDDNLVFSIIACLCCDAFCLGCIALICSWQSREAANANRMDEAREKGQLAKKLSIAAVIATIVITLIMVILYFTVLGAVIGEMRRNRQSIFDDFQNNWNQSG